MYQYSMASRAVYHGKYLLHGSDVPKLKKLKEAQGAQHITCTRFVLIWPDYGQAGQTPLRELFLRDDT